MILVACAGVLYYLQSLLSTSRSRRRNAKRTNQENGLREPNHDCCLLPHFTSQCHTLLGCRWFHDDSPTVYRQLYRSSKTSQKVREELAKNPPKARAFSTPSGRKDVTPEQPTAITSKKKHKNRKRWKQRSR